MISTMIATPVNTDRTAAAGRLPQQEVCQQCGRRVLSTTLRSNLYQRIGAGYEEAYAAAVAYLEKLTPKGKGGSL